MSQHDMVIANGDGAEVRADVNNALQALASQSKGNSRPATPYTGQIWIDDNSPSSTLWTWYVYDGSDDIIIGLLDSTNHLFIPLLSPFCGTVTGTNTLTASLSPAPAPPAYSTGAVYSFIAANTNTGAVTFNLDDLGAKDVTKYGSTALEAGDIQAGTLCVTQYDGTRLQLINPFNPKPSGAIIQSANASYTTRTAITASIPLDDTIPQNTEGTEILTVSITPKFSTSKLRVRYSGMGSNSVAFGLTSAVFRDATANAVYASLQGEAGGGAFLSVSQEFQVDASSTSETTFKLRLGTSAGTFYTNGDATNRYFGGVAEWNLTIEEIAA